MTDSENIDEVVQFILRYRLSGLSSTSAEVVSYKGDLYNVTESTLDPKRIPDAVGRGWKRLLIDRADLADAQCYVTDPLPHGESSHPEFQVGGHMTPNHSGRVEVGSNSYLMPLCKWHNSTGRNEIAFQHEETRMLRLGGFMEGDTPVTFAMRLGQDSSPRLLSFDARAGEWSYRSIEKGGAFAQSLHTSALHLPDIDISKFAVFEKRNDRYFLAMSHL